MSVITNARILVSEYEFTGDTNSIDYGYDIDMVDDTRLGAAVTTRIMTPGLVARRLSFSGFSLSGVGEVETVLSAALAVNDRIISIVPTGGAEGARVFPMIGTLSGFKPFGGTIGDSNKIESTWQASAFSVPANMPALAGISLATGAKTTSDTGAGVQQGAVGASETVQAWMHVTAVSGTNPTLDMLIESDDNAGFASATTRFTFSQATGLQVELEPVVSGAITDDYWRANWTIGGTDTPTFTVLVGMAISGNAVSI